MAAVFNALEIFGIADQIEVAAAVFYKQAAEYADGDEKTLLLKLAELEESHKSYFSSLQDIYGLQEVSSLIDINSEETRHLNWIAEGHVVHHLGNFFTQGDLSVTSILKKALEFEKDTVVYFTALKAALVSEDEKAKVDMLILEESSHVGLLSKKIREIENSS